jgi:hypothetical protein
MSVVLEGDLEHFQPAEILQLLQLAQATGRLELARSDASGPGPARSASAGSETVDIHFEQGRPVCARTSGHSVRTGEILVHRGHVTRAALEGALEAQRHGDAAPIGQVLAGRGATVPARVAEAVHESQRRILYGVLLWRAGRFRFLAGERAVTDLPLDLDLDRLILEGLRLADQARVGR